MTSVGGARAACPLIQLSNSPRSRASSQHSCRRDSSAPSKQARGGALPFFPSLTCVREAERRSAPLSRHPLRRGAACLYGTHAFRRSTAAILCGVIVQDGPVIQAALPRPFTRPHRPLKAAPSSGADDAVAPWDVVTSPRLQAPHPAPSAERLRKTPSASKVAWNLT